MMTEPIIIRLVMHYLFITFLSLMTVA